LSADEIDIAARGIEVRVVGYYLTGFHHDTEQYVFGRTALMRWYHLFKAENILNGVSKAIPAAGACIGFIAAHQGPPGVEERIVVGITDQVFALAARGELDRLHHFDPERFDNCLHAANFGCNRNCLK
jgi:hypothetical protein